MQDHPDHRYDDMIHLDRPVSPRHAPMPRQSRAAQFSPFAALTGYDDAIAETERLTTPRIELDDSRRAVLSDRLAPGPVKTIDPVTHTVTMQSGAVIPMGDILTVETQ